MSVLLKVPFVQAVRLKRDEVPGFDGYPLRVPSVRHLEQIEFHPAMTFLVGENGTGQSTLIEAIAVKLGFNAEGGSKNFPFETRATHSPILMAYPHARIHPLPDSGIEETRCTDTEHYRVTMDFLNPHERMLELLLVEDEPEPKRKKR